MLSTRNTVVASGVVWNQTRRPMTQTKSNIPETTTAVYETYDIHGCRKFYTLL